jgi:hypothetical protein
MAVPRPMWPTTLLPAVVSRLAIDLNYCLARVKSRCSMRHVAFRRDEFAQRIQGTHPVSMERTHAEAGIVESTSVVGSRFR